MPHGPRRLSVAAALVITSQAAAQSTAAPGSVAVKPPASRIEVDLLAGAFVPGLESWERGNRTLAVRGHVGAVAATRLRVGFGARRDWALLVSATIARTGVVLEGVPAFPEGAFRDPVREYARSYGDMGIGVERRLRLGTRTTLLASVEATLGHFRTIERGCDEASGRGFTCATSPAQFAGENWGPTLVPAVGLAHRMTDRSSLVVAWRPALLKLTERTPEMVVAGIRFAPGGGR
jgi:hypothetical protein